MDLASCLEDLLLADPLRLHALQAVASLDLPDCWIGAGFIRDAVWDHLHGSGTAAPVGDVDVVWFRGSTPEEELDRDVERLLCGLLPGLAWSVKNQARMHSRNGDRPYASVADAMRHWPETATAVAAACYGAHSVEINAPFGLDDLFALRVRPTPAFLTHKREIFDDRVRSKRWMERYPMLSLRAGTPEGADR